MRKLESEHENPIDDVLYCICDKLINFCTDYKITSNMITLFRIILSIYITYLLYYTNKIIHIIVLLIIFHFLDCMDGHLARSTNQVTKMGDYLDHFADLSLFFIIFVYMLIKKYPNKNIILISLIFLTYVLSCHIGLQQLQYKKTNPQATEESLDLCNNFHNLSLDTIKYTKYFGHGTFWIIIILFIYYIKIS